MNELLFMAQAAARPAESRNALARLLMAPEYRGWARQMGGPRAVEESFTHGDYDYTRAVSAGVVPEPYAPDGGRYHWPSVLPPVGPRAASTPLKAPGHLTMWMEDFMQRTGVDPWDAPPEVWAQAPDVVGSAVQRAAGPSLRRSRR